MSLQVCLKMRSLTPGVPPPIIMISGKASTKDVIKGLQVGTGRWHWQPLDHVVGGLHPSAVSPL